MKKIALLVLLILCCAWSWPSGIGDMQRSVYDTDGNGVVDSAEETDPVAGAITGIVKADGAGNISAATAGVDYLEPNGDGSDLTGVVAASVPLSGISNPTDNLSPALAAYYLSFTSTKSTAGGVLTLSNTVADLTADVSLIDLKFTDDGDDNGYFLRGYDNSGTDLKWYVRGSGDAYFNSVSFPDVDGSNKISVANNSAITPTASAMEIYPEGNVWKANENGTEKTMALVNSAGNVADEKKHFRFTLLDPDGVFTNDAEVCIVPETDAALTITKITVTCDADPTTEFTGDLKYADAFIGLANSTVINDFDTAAGVREDDSITSGSVAAGKCIYIVMDDPDDDLTQVSFDVEYDYDR